MIARRLSAALLVLVALAGLLFAVTSQAADDDKGILADLISRALSTPTSRVSIGGIDGALSSDAVIRDVQIADRDGVWLRLDRARIVWRRLALLQGRLEIDALEIAHLDLVRRPVPAETLVAGEDQPLLPELPVKVDVKRFALEELRLGEPLLGTAARLTASGAVRLGPASEGLDARMDVRRLDQPGTLTARLGFVPNGERLDLAAMLDEPPGGILVRAAGIPGLPAAKLNLGGQGTLDAFRATLAFEAGADIGATGTATLSRDGTDRRLALDLGATVSGLLPEVVAPVFAGATRLAGTVAFANDGSVRVPGIALTATALRLDITGTVAADRVADLRLTAANVPTRESRTSVGGADIRRLAFDGRVTGALSAPVVDASLVAEDARLPAGEVGRLDATFRAAPAGTGAGARGPVQLAGDARATGLSLRNPALSKAVGAEASLVLRGTSTSTGVLSFDRLELNAATVQARFSGRAGSSEVNGRLTVSAPDLARFGDVAGLALRGAATATGDVEGTPRANRYAVRVDAHGTGFGTGLALADGLLGGRFDANGRLRLEADGSVGFDQVSVTGAHASLRIDGAATPERADVTAALTVPDLAKADGRLTGRGEVGARLTGTLARPDATARIALADATALGRPVPRLSIEAVARDLLGDLDAHLTLDGEVDRKPARGALQVTRPAGGGTRLQGIDVAVGSVAVRGDVALDAQHFASGRLGINARNLDDLSPLALHKLSGELDAEIALAVSNGGQDGQVKAHAASVAGYGVTVRNLDADLAVSDLYRRPVIDGRAVVERATVAGEEITAIRLDATGTPQASDVVLTAAARGFGVDARARIVPGDRTRIEVQTLSARRAGQRLALAAPATLTVIDGGVEIAGASLALGSGRLTVNGRAGSDLNLTVEARAVPLSTAEIVAPGLGLSGSLDGAARVTGPAGAPSGTYRARLAGFTARAVREAGLPPIDATASGNLEGSRATVDATLALGAAGSLRIGGSAPLGDGALDLVVRGSVDAALANRSLGAAGRRVTGRVALDARLTGSLDKPLANGTATLTGGSYLDAALGIRLDNVRARLIARGSDIAVESASASTRNGGQINASGRVDLDPAQGFPGALRITAQRAQLVQTPVATAVLNLDVNLSGPLARAPRASGRIDVVSLDVTIPERLPTTLQPLPGTRHIHPTPTTVARLRLARESARGRAASGTGAEFDLVIAAPGHILVHGRGLNAELGGSLRLTGTLAKPVPVGAFDLRQGRLEILTSRLDLTRGNLTFSGDLTPELDLQATTQAGGASLAVTVTGPASEPQFAFTSSPDLPPDEVLSRLLFGTPSGQLSTGQALALAQAAAQYSGGSGAFEDLRKSLGLAGVDINLGASGGPAIGLSRALNSRISVGVRAGAGAGQTAVGVDVNLGKGFKLQGEAGAEGAVSVGIGAEREW